MTGTLSGPLMIHSKLKQTHQNRRPRQTTRPLHSPLVLTPGEREIWSGEGRLAQPKRSFPVFRKKPGVCCCSGRELQQFPPTAPTSPPAPLVRGAQPEAQVRAPRPAPGPAKDQVKGRGAQRGRAGSARTKSGPRRGSGLLRPRRRRSPIGARSFGKPGDIKAQLGDAGTLRATDSRPAPHPRPRPRHPGSGFQSLTFPCPPPPRPSPWSPARGVPQSRAQPP